MSHEIEELAPIIEEMKNNTLKNYVLEGLSSSLIGGENYGTVRLFENTRDNHHNITPHSHRYNFSCLVLRGNIENTVWTPDLSIDEDYYAATTLFYNGTVGDYKKVDEFEVLKYEKTCIIYDIGDVYTMSHDQIHSIKFSRDAVVLFFEGPELKDSSIILQPYIDGKVIPTSEVKEWMFEPAKN